MIDKHLFHDLQHISVSLFHKNFFSVYHGSISARIGPSSFMINSKETILDEFTEESLVSWIVRKETTAGLWQTRMPTFMK